MKITRDNHGQYINYFSYLGHFSSLRKTVPERRELNRYFPWKLGMCAALSKLIYWWQPLYSDLFLQPTILKNILCSWQMRLFLVKKIEVLVLKTSEEIATYWACKIEVWLQFHHFFWPCFHQFRFLKGNIKIVSNSLVFFSPHICSRLCVFSFYFNICDIPLSVDWSFHIPFQAVVLLNVLRYLEF